MDVLLDDEETLIQRTVGEFLASACSTAVVRTAEKSDEKYSKALWAQFAELGWLGLCLPEDAGGQGLPLTYLGLVLEKIGHHIAPLPVHATMVPALVIARYGSPAQRRLLARVVSGEIQLSYAIVEGSGRWTVDDIGLTARREGDVLVLDGSKHFVDNFPNAQHCLVVVRILASGRDEEEVAAVLVGGGTPGISCEALLPTAKDAESAVHFEDVRVPLDSIVGMLGQRSAVVATLMDYAAVLLVCQMQGAARRAMEFAVDYVNQRQAFGQPIGAFQAIQHMAADMVNAVDGAQLLAREAIWRLSMGLPASVEVSQAKSFANEKCLMVCRSAQQMHGGIGFIAEFDLNLWYRRVTSWSLRGGTTYEHRARIAAALFDVPGAVRLGQAIEIPSPPWIDRRKSSLSSLESLEPNPIDRLDSRAVRLETACGPSAKMVWRRWGTGRPVLLLHGGAGSWMHWVRNIEALALTRSVWVPDIPGFGDSDLPGGDLDADSLAPFVLQGALELLRGERFDLVGFSFGGLVSALMAAQAPPTLDRLVLVSVAAMGLVSEPPVLKGMRGVIDLAERREIVRFNLGALMLSDAVSIDDLAIDVQTRSAPCDRVKNRKLVLTDTLLRLPPQWRCTVFGIWGRRDALYRHQFDQLLERSKRLGMRERIVLDDAGHWLQYERSDEFNQILARLLEAPLNDKKRTNDE